MMGIRVFLFEEVVNYFQRILLISMILMEFSENVGYEHVSV